MSLICMEVCRSGLSGRRDHALALYGSIVQTIATVLCLSALALGAPLAADDSVKVPLAQGRAVTRATGDVDTARFFNQLNQTVQKYSGKSLKSYADVSGLSKRQTASSVALTDASQDNIDSSYYGPGTVGAGDGSPQAFTFIFDTGSSDTFVPGPACGTDQGCAGTTRYDQGGKDEGNTTSVTYGSGQVAGENYFDDVTVAGKKATGQSIISLTQAAGFGGLESNALMGMGFQSISNSHQPPYFKTLIDQGQVSTPEFSFYLGRAADNTGANSELTLGGRDSSKFTGAVTKVPVTTPGYWQVALDQVLVNGFASVVDKLATKGQAAIDTGTTLVLAPLAAATSIFARIPGAIPLPLELINGALEPVLFIFPCASKAKVEIQFAGKPFAINAKDLSFGTLTGDFADIVGNNTLATVLDSASYCLAGIAGFDIDPTQNLYVVGDVFLKNWYSIYSYNGPSVSFAKAV
nr:aspartic protease [Quercus suber]